MFIARNRWLLSGLASIGVGYIQLDAGSMTLAPILLVLGYCVLIPLHLWARYRMGVGE